MICAALRRIGERLACWLDRSPDHPKPLRELICHLS
jgi:hypothetical protein